MFEEFMIRPSQNEDGKDVDVPQRPGYDSVYLQLLLFRSDLIHLFLRTATILLFFGVEILKLLEFDQILVYTFQQYSFWQFWHREALHSNLM